VLSAIHDFYAMIRDLHEITFGAVTAMFVMVGAIVGLVMFAYHQTGRRQYEATNKRPLKSHTATISRGCGSR
jgi:hypothetical protein